jgi:hypothetical protein
MMWMGMEIEDEPDANRTMPRILIYIQQLDGTIKVTSATA